ncbi:hypothetical protein CLOM_g21716, partial [Closterium sp. NIES-68]
MMYFADRLTKMVYFAAYKKCISAKETAQLFISTIVRPHGVPIDTSLDHESKFTSKFWHHLWEQFGTRVQFSLVYYPETDGQTDWTNKTMEQLICTTCDDVIDLETHLPLIEFTYKNAPLANTLQLPFCLNYEQNPT